jgi:nucleotide-binding universal stress UspA family protein
MKRQDISRRISATGLSLQRILVPVDFSPLSKKALHYALRLAREFDADLTLIHVIEPDVPPMYEGWMIAPRAIANGSNGASAKKLKELARSVQTAQMNPVRPIVRTGLPAQEIVEAAKQFDVDLIVIATHGYTGWKHFAIGSTAERVVRAAPCPVLVVREKEHEFS